MSIIWAEGFDHYGTTGGGRTNMLSGAWAQFSWGSGGNGTVEVSPTQARTGANSLFIRHTANSSTRTVARRVVGAARLILGVGFGIFFPSLPTVNKQCGLSIRNASNENILGIIVQSDGAIGLYTGQVEGGSGDATLIGASDPVITTAAWSHIEVKTVIDNVVGEVEVRVNGRPVMHLTDLNLGTLHATQLQYGTFAGTGGSSVEYYIDDIVVWDDNGDENNDFLGVQRVETIFPVADTVAADWTVFGTSDGYDAIDNVPPDGDTTYILGDTPNQISEFELDTLPPETETIVGVYIPVMAKLEDAGTGAIQVSLVSDSEVSLGPDQVLTPAYTYWGGVHEVDPNTGDAWTKESLEAALLRVEKTL